MKKILAFILASSLMTLAIEVTAQDNGDKEQAKIARQLEKLYNRRAKLRTSYSRDSIKYYEVQETINSLESKNDVSSSAYNSAIRKSGKYYNSMTETNGKLQEIDREISELKHQLSPQEKPAAVSNYQVETVEEPSNKATIDDAPNNEEKYETSTKQTKKRNNHKSTVKAEAEEATVNEEVESKDNKHKSGDDDGSTLIITILFAVGIFFYGAYDFRRKHRCPECGKWFVMNSQGDVRVWDHDNSGNIKRRGARKRYKCSNCGHVTEFVQWFNK